jgi:hypothetical protein
MGTGDQESVMKLRVTGEGALMGKMCPEVNDFTASAKREQFVANNPLVQISPSCLDLGTTTCNGYLRRLLILESTSKEPVTFQWMLGEFDGAGASEGVLSFEPDFGELQPGERLACLATYKAGMETQCLQGELVLLASHSEDSITGKQPAATLQNKEWGVARVDGDSHESSCTTSSFLQGLVILEHMAMTGTQTEAVYPWPMHQLSLCTTVAFLPRLMPTRAPLLLQKAPARAAMALKHFSHCMSRILQCMGKFLVRSNSRNAASSKAGGMAYGSKLRIAARELSTTLLQVSSLPPGTVLACLVICRHFSSKSSAVCETPLASNDESGQSAAAVFDVLHEALREVLMMVQPFNSLTSLQSLDAESRRPYPEHPDLSTREANHSKRPESLPLPVPTGSASRTGKPLADVNMQPTDAVPNQDISVPGLIEGPEFSKGNQENDCLLSALQNWQKANFVEYVFERMLYGLCQEVVASD